MSPGTTPRDAPARVVLPLGQRELADRLRSEQLEVHAVADLDRAGRTCADGAGGVAVLPAHWLTDPAVLLG